LRNYFGSSNPLSEVIREIGGDCGFRLIIDQLDNLIGLGAANLLTGLAEECASSDGVDVVVISRNRQAREVDMLRRLTATGFIEIESQGLRDEEVVAILKILGITNVSQGLIGLGRNLLNLEIICIIKQQRPDFAFAAIPDEITLWDKYVDVLQEREGGLESADQLIGAAMNLARQCLKSEEMSVVFDGPLRAAERRLESWNVIVCEEEFVYRFKYEKFQDYLYSRLMCGRGEMPRAVLSEIGRHRMRIILPLMHAIYRSRKSPRLAQFLLETFNVNVD